MTPVTEAVPALKLTERINRIEPSATMAVVAEADKLRQQGIDVVDFGAGEPHFSTPQHVKDAAIAAIQNNFSKYTAVGGTAELRDAIVLRHATDFQSGYRREESMASVGGKHALFNALQVLVDGTGPDGTAPGQRDAGAAVTRHRRGSCGVEQVDQPGRAALGIDEDRLGADAAVQDAAVVQLGERAGERAADGEDARDRRRLLDREQRAAGIVVDDRCERPRFDPARSQGREGREPGSERRLAAARFARLDGERGSLDPTRQQHCPAAPLPHAPPWRALGERRLPLEVGIHRPPALSTCSAFRSRRLPHAVVMASRALACKAASNT